MVGRMWPVYEHGQNKRGEDVVELRHGKNVVRT